MTEYLDYSEIDIRVRVENLYSLEIIKVPSKIYNKSRYDALVFYISINGNLYFKSEKDKLLFKLKYGI